MSLRYILLEMKLTYNETKQNRQNRDRKNSGLRNCGGVCFYVKQCINFIVREDLKITDIENICIEIRNPRSKPFIVATWYRPPNSLVEIFSPFETLLGKLDSLDIEYYILGDLNCNMDTPTDNDTRNLTSITDVYGLHQLITEPTRITEKSATLIDVIFTNCPDKVSCSGVRHIGISDHSIVFAYRKLTINGLDKGHTSICYRNFRNFDRDKFRNDVATQDWDCVNNFSHDPNRMWLEWKGLFSTTIDKHATPRTARVRARGSPWITSELKNIMHNRDILKLKAIRSNNLNDWEKFKQQRNKVNQAIRAAKQRYYHSTLSEHKSDSKKTWEIINEITSRKSGKISVKELKVNGQSITNSNVLADEFNNHFATIGPKLASEIPSQCNNSHLEYLTNTNERFQFRPTTTNQVLSLLNKLNKSKATGLDKISARFVRECADLICIPLCHMFNQSLSLGIFPEDWKCARVTPLFKQGNRDDMNNYRPISVVPIIAKVF